jgi:hypothetical protein
VGGVGTVDAVVAVERDGDLVAAIVNPLDLDKLSGLSKCAVIYDVPQQHGGRMRFILCDALGRKRFLLSVQPGNEVIYELALALHGGHHPGIEITRRGHYLPGTEVQRGCQVLD